LEREMSLPTGEQQILDGIAESLRASEPRLASMFAIFGRLVRNEGPPLRERITVPGLFPGLAGLRRRPRSARFRSASVRSASVRSASLRSERRTWQLVFLIANVVAAVVIVSVLIALNSHPSRSCPQHPQPTAPVFESHSVYCPAQTGSGGSQQSR
jgi:hypothetical protein